MEQANFIQVNFVESNSVKHHGSRKSIDKYLNNGYYIKENSSGFWLLVKPSAAIVLLSNSTGQHKFNMRREILDYYGRENLTSALVEKFNRDASSGRLKFYMDDRCYSFE